MLSDGGDDNNDFQPSIPRSQPSKRPKLCTPPRKFYTQNRSRVQNGSSGKAEDGFNGVTRLKRSKLYGSVSVGKENFAPVPNRSLRDSSKGMAVVLAASNAATDKQKCSDQAGFCSLPCEISSSVVASDDVDGRVSGFDLVGECCSLDMIRSSIDCNDVVEFAGDADKEVDHSGDENRLQVNEGYMGNLIEGRLMSRTGNQDGHCEKGGVVFDDEDDNFEVHQALDELTKLCEEGGDYDSQDEEGVIVCPLCGVDISDLDDESRLSHTNDCLDKSEDHLGEILLPDNDDKHTLCPKEVDAPPASSRPALDISPVTGWLRGLGLGRYVEIFLREEIDLETLKWLTEEDLSNIGITALGPRKKLVHALAELRDRSGRANVEYSASKPRTNEIKNVNSKLITDYFLGAVPGGNKVSRDSVPRTKAKRLTSSGRKCREVPPWSCIPGTSFRVDGFRYLRRDCSHWFLTHFHLDHYQGLTRSFCHGKLYCSEITAKLVNMKLRIPWDRIEVLPLNQEVTIADIRVTCLDANHCPGSIMILFEPPNGQAALHTGDFRFSEEMARLSIWRDRRIHTLILDTTYCDPQYDFPKQEDVTQFVIDAIQAESFNPSTLFLIGSYTVGKERLFLEVGRALQRKIYVGAAKLRIIRCFRYSEEELQWFTANEHESHIHVVPMWTLASFKRLKHVASQYSQRFSLVVAFSPTGWTFGKGKKSSGGRRCQQGTIIRYEVPYSEHSSFGELKEFVKLLSPRDIIPIVNNDGPESTESMLWRLSS